jgi:glycosyltransferase involved in cell wall biosynthesis
MRQPEPASADMDALPETARAPLDASHADPHQALQALIEAAALTRAKVAVLPVPMHWRDRPWLPRPVALLAKALVFLGPHWRMLGHVWRARDHDLIVVREFLTQVLIVVWPLLWPLRRRVYFLINHNLQEAHQRGLERAVLRVLHRTGCRFGCFETTAGFAEIGIVPDGERFLVLPHPLVGTVAARPAAQAADEPVIGVIGEVRAEKGSEALLETLLQLRDEGRVPARLVLGCPQAEVRAIWQERGFAVVDTSDRAGYLAALDRCDVVILNYQRERYQYRPSGVAADALARGAGVVCPDFPLMRRQLSAPAEVGAVFGSRDELAAATLRALALRPTLPDALARHQRARDPAALACLLDRFVADLRGAPHNERSRR